MVFNTSGIFHDVNLFEGLLGMGLPDRLMVIDLADEPKTPFQKLLSANQLQPIFAFKLSNNGSFVTLGGYRHEDYQGDIGWMRPRNPNGWMIYIISARLGDALIDKEFLMYIDTGSSYIYAPQPAFDAIVYKLNASEEGGTWKFDCPPSKPQPIFKLELGTGVFLDFNANIY